MSTPPTQPPSFANKTELALMPRPKSKSYSVTIYINHRDPNSSNSSEDCACDTYEDVIELFVEGTKPAIADHLDQSLVADQLHAWAEGHARATHPAEYNARRDLFLEVGINYRYRMIKVANGCVRWCGGVAHPGLFDSTLEEAEDDLRGKGLGVHMNVDVDWWFIPMEEIIEFISSERERR